MGIIQFFNQGRFAMKGPNVGADMVAEGGSDEGGGYRVAGDDSGRGGVPIGSGELVSASLKSDKVLVCQENAADGACLPQDSPPHFALAPSIRPSHPS